MTATTVTAPSAYTSVDERERAYRRAVGHLASGVTIVLTTANGEDRGATASAVCSLSQWPPMVVVCLGVDSETGRAVRETGRLTINVLTEQQAGLAARFGSRRPDRFDGVELDRDEQGLPRLRDSLVSFAARVEFSVQAATHTVFVCGVEDLELRGGLPLTYFRGRFGSFRPATDPMLPARVVTFLHHAPPGRAEPGPSVTDLAQALQTQPAAVAEALVPLLATGLITEDAGAYQLAEPPV